MSKFIRLLIAFLSAALLFPLLVSADVINFVDPNSPYVNITKLLPSNYVKTAIEILIGGAGVLSFLYLLLGGVQWITAGSDKDAVEKSRKKIINALIGLALVFSVYAILFVVRALFGIDLIGINITRFGT